MNNTVISNLSKLFEKHRIVFWYDPKGEFEDELDDITSVFTLLRSSEYNDFALKYKILREEPKTKFLVYYEKDEPSYEDNWLLDVQLANAVFHTDADSVLLSDLGLPHSFIGAVRKHSEFFKDARNKKKLASRISEKMDEKEFEEALVSITFGEDSYNPQHIADALVIDEIKNDGKRYKLLEVYNLIGFIWNDFAEVYGYSSEKPSVEDFYLSVFESSLNKSLGEDSVLSADAISLLKHWKDSSKFREEGIYREISDYASEQLSAMKKVALKSISDLVDFDDYSFVEEEIISKLIAAVKDRTMTGEAIRQVEERRRSSYWFSDYADIYEALVIGKTLLDEIKACSITIDSAEEGIRKYSGEWYRIDNHYRRYMYLVIEKSQTAKNLLSDITLDIEAGYVNSFLIPIGEKWTPYAKEMLSKGWNYGFHILKQWMFYSYNIQGVMQKGNKAIIIISDALRYEVGDDLVSEINSQQRYSATIKPMLSSVPTYTQLGMAALLPHKELEMGSDGETVYIENHTSTKGLINREKILKDTVGGKAAAFDAGDILKKNTKELKEIIADNSLIYIYHNVIDKNGEENLLKAADDAIRELKTLIKNLGSSNASNIWLTSDHGFLYQESELEEHQYLSDGTVKGKNVSRWRRFAIGYDLESSHSLAISKFSDLGFSNTDGLEVAFPNSILRMRLQGADTNFVHGGLSLQEIIIPLIKIEKSKKDDVTDVSLKLLTRLKTITTGSIVLTFYQEDYVSDKVHGFEAVFGLYSEDGKPLSDIEKRSVTSESLDSKAREFQIELHLNKLSESYNRREIYLKVYKVLQSRRLEEKISQGVMLSRSMASDFDF